MILESREECGVLDQVKKSLKTSWKIFILKTASMDIVGNSRKCDSGLPLGFHMPYSLIRVIILLCWGAEVPSHILPAQFSPGGEAWCLPLLSADYVPFFQCYCQIALCFSSYFNTQSMITLNFEEQSIIQSFLVLVSLQAF